MFACNTLLYVYSHIVPRGVNHDIERYGNNCQNHLFCSIHAEAPANRILNLTCKAAVLSAKTFNRIKCPHLKIEVVRYSGALLEYLLRFFSLVLRAIQSPELVQCERRHVSVVTQFAFQLNGCLQRCHAVCVES